MSLARKYIRPPFKRGDQVIVRPDLKAFDSYVKCSDLRPSLRPPCGLVRGMCVLSVTHAMERYRGRKAYVAKTSLHLGFPTYRLDIDGGSWNWAEDMFVGRPSIPCRCLLGGGLH